MAAPNSRSEESSAGCFSLEPEEREPLEILESDAIAGYEPPTGELLRDVWHANRSIRGVGQIKKSWNFLADETSAAEHIANAMKANGWTLADESQNERSILLKAHKLLGDFCALAYAALFTDGLLELELIPAATVEQCQIG